MYRFLLKPRWIAVHLLVLVLMVTMVNLGLWQVRRLHERQHFNRTVSERLAAPVTSDDEALAAATDERPWEWRRVSVTGTYVDHPPIEVVNRSVDGQQGRQILGAVRTAGGTVVVIDRGFLPVTVAIPPAPTGSVTVVGRVRTSEVRHLGQNTDDPNAVLTQVRRVDLRVVGRQFAPTVAPVYLQALQTDPPDAAALAPMPLPDLTDEGPHLSYAIQWFIFTACAAVGWVLAVRRSATPAEGRRRRGPPPIDEELSAAKH